MVKKIEYMLMIFIFVLQAFKSCEIYNKINIFPFSLCPIHVKGQKYEGVYRFWAFKSCEIYNKINIFPFSLCPIHVKGQKYEGVYRFWSV